jgi:cell division protein FtsL
MDEQLLRSVQKLQKQLRAIKIMLGFFFFMLLAMLAILGFVTYKVITFTQDVTNRITNIQTQTRESLDLKTKVCDNKSLTGLLGSNNDFCQ